MVQSGSEQEYYYGTGKRKTSIAKVRLYLGNGNIIRVKDQPLEEAFPWLIWQVTVKEPLEATNSIGRFHVMAQVKGGGVSSQCQAVRHGIARALLVADEGYRRQLRQHGLLTRDAREKERQTPGLKRARKATQYTKR